MMAPVIVPPDEVLTAMRDEGHTPHSFRSDGWRTWKSVCSRCGASAEVEPTEEGWELTYDSFTGRSCT